MAAYEDERRRFDDPRNILLEARNWASNAVRFAEGGDEQAQRAAAVFANVAVAHAIMGLASAILAQSPQRPETR
jgi:hypothetical protein